MTPFFRHLRFSLIFKLLAAGTTIHHVFLYSTMRLLSLWGLHPTAVQVTSNKYMCMSIFSPLKSYIDLLKQVLGRSFPCEIQNIGSSVALLIGDPICIAHFKASSSLTFFYNNTINIFKPLKFALLHLLGVDSSLSYFTRTCSDTFVVGCRIKSEDIYIYFTFIVGCSSFFSSSQVLSCRISRRGVRIHSED